MKTFEVAIQVGPIRPSTVERLKAAGHKVYRRGEVYRVDVTATLLGENSIRAQAHVLVADVIAEFDLAPITNPATYTIRDPDANLDARPDLMLSDVKRSDQPDPLASDRSPWWRSTRDRRSGFHDG